MALLADDTAVRNSSENQDIMVESLILTSIDHLMKDDDEKVKGASEDVIKQHKKELKEKKADAEYKAEQAEKERERSTTPQPSRFPPRRQEGDEEVTCSDAMRDIGELREPGGTYWYADYDPAREPESNIRPVTPTKRRGYPGKTRKATDPDDDVEAWEGERGRR